MNRFFPAFSTVLAGLLCASGCESTTQLPLTLVFPEDTTDLQRADNAALVVFPDGLNVSVPVEGTSFSLEVELEPDGTTRVVDLYLADGDDLQTSAPNTGDSECWLRAAARTTAEPHNVQGTG